MGDRCTGHCCEAFALPASPAGLKSRAAHGGEVAKVYAIVRHLGFGYPKEFLGPDGVRTSKRTEKQHYYTCTKFDKETRNCTDYDNRPEICRDYPGDTRCGHEHCTWDAARNKACDEFRRVRKPRRFLSIEKYAVVKADIQEAP